MRKNLTAITLAAFLLLTGCASQKPADSAAETTDVMSDAAEETTAEAADSETAEETTEAATKAVSADIPQIPGYTMLWNDEFDGNALDETLWNYEPHEPGWTNEELQEYTTSTDNVFLRDGNLVIKAIQSDKGGKPYYTSGKVTTQNKQDFTYGKVVARAKVPEGKGLWPAIWMMPQDESYYGQWPKCGEIDIMEVLGSQVDTAYGTLHYGAPHAEQQGTFVLKNSTFADSFHEFSVEWEPGEIRWYIDGELYHTVNDWFTAEEGGEDKPYPAPFDQPFFVQMNLAVGGTWPGDPDESTDFDKAEFEIDYVRVYQKDSYDTDVARPEQVFREADLSGNFIRNGDFSAAEDLEDDVDWKFMLFEGGKGAASIADNTMTITSEEEGSADYSVQLVQPEIPMVRGKNYRLTFDAWADEERDIITCVSAPKAGWIRYLPDTTLTVPTEKKTFTFDFQMKEKDDPFGRLEFNLGHHGSTATVHIQNVSIEMID